MNQPRQQPEEPTSPGLAHYFDLIVRHRWWVISSGCVAWALAIVASLVIPAKYKSETTILIEQPKVSAQFLPQNVTVDLQQRLQSLTEQILSRPRLEQIMDTFQLYGKQQNQHATDGMVDRMRKDIDIELLKTPGHDLSGFKLSYSAKSPILAQKVAGELTSLFIQENLSSQRQLSEDTTAFLDSQLAEAGKDLEQQEKTLGEFRSKYLGELPEQLAGNVQILSGLQSRLQSETEALNQAEQQRLYLVSLVGESKSARPKPAGDPGLASSSSTTALDEQIDKMKSDLAALLTRYTPQHPDVIRLQEQIASAEKLRQQAAQDPKGGKKSVESGPQVISPVAQLESQLKANELEIANRKQQVKSLEAQIEQYQARLNLTPMREQELASVARNHEQSRTNYESLLAKKLQSEMASDLEKRQQGETFQIIDPPSAPQKPYFPNRLLFGLAGVVAGVVIGSALVITNEAIEPMVYHEDEIQEMTSAPILVTVPPLPTAHELQVQSQNRKLEFIAAGLILVIIPTITLIAQMRG